MDFKPVMFSFTKETLQTVFYITIACTLCFYYSECVITTFYFIAFCINFI